MNIDKIYIIGCRFDFDWMEETNKIEIFILCIVLKAERLNKTLNMMPHMNRSSTLRKLQSIKFYKITCSMSL